MIVLLIPILVVLYIGLLAMYKGAAISLLWGWFIVPVFHLPELSVVQAIGIGLMFTSMMPTPSFEKDNFESFYNPIVKITASIVFGYIIQLFM